MCGGERIHPNCSVMRIKGRLGSLGSGKGMRAELPERSFPWEITQNHNPGKNQTREGAQKWVVQRESAGPPTLGWGAETRSLPALASQSVPSVACWTLLPPLDTPATAGPQTRLLGSGVGTGKTTNPSEQISTCGACNLVLLNYLPRLAQWRAAFPQPAALPACSTAQHFLGWFSSGMGGKRYEGWEDLKHLSEASATQKSWQRCCQVQLSPR